ncbi:MAG: diguanylate cyclase [Synergistaceae bacterium]|nr:diguanylate cyclase [Synergistaceae bacterium]
MTDMTVKVNGISFPNPVLTAAGPNVGTCTKLMEAVRGGAGGIVSKTVSPIPAIDPRPTIRKGPCGGLINCETWAEIPVEEYFEGYRKVKESGIPLILSIGYSPEDMRYLGALLEKEIQPDAFEFSTHYTGKSIEPLLAVARALRETVSVPIWMKISPNTPDIEELAIKASEFVDAFVAINSLGPVLDFDPENPVPPLGSSFGQGWLSGPTILPLALRMVYQIASSQPKPVIGVGGVSSGRDAVKFFQAGASLVQICTAAITKGSEIYGKVAGEIDHWLEERKIPSPDYLRGEYARNIALFRKERA